MVEETPARLVLPLQLIGVRLIQKDTSQDYRGSHLCLLIKQSRLMHHNVHAYAT